MQQRLIHSVVLDAGTVRFPPAAWAGLSAFGTFHLHEKTSHEPASVIGRLQGAQAVFTNKVPLSGAILRALPDLRFVGVLATGYNIIDGEAARAAGIVVCNVPAYSTASTAQHAIALILELANRVGDHAAGVRTGEWLESEHFCYWKQAPWQLEGKNIGVFGLGAIGSRVAEVVHALGAQVLGFSPSGRQLPGLARFRSVDRETLLRESDLVTLHCPETPETRRMINSDTLARMKPGAFLVNTSRGGLVDEPALRAALESGRLAGAALDVVSVEPMRVDCCLRDAPNCFITPHLAWASEESRRRLLEVSFGNLAAFLAGHPQNRVLAPA